MVESSDKMRSTGEGNGKLLQYSCLENHMNSMKRSLTQEWGQPPSAVLATLPVQWQERVGLDVGKAGETKYLTSLVAQGDGRVTVLPV